jgi:hypothetical protein
VVYLTTQSKDQIMQPRMVGLVELWTAECVTERYDAVVMSVTERYDVVVMSVCDRTVWCSGNESVWPNGMMW